MAARRRTHRSLTHLSDVPLFADSQASRLIQAADFVCWALWRYYSQPTPDEQWIKQLWAGFDHADGKMHGLVHVNPASLARDAVVLPAQAAPDCCLEQSDLSLLTFNEGVYKDVKTA
jgi:hypothetical protein